MGDLAVIEPFSYNPEAGFYDEALLPGGAPRPHYVELFRRLSDAGLATVAELVAAGAEATGVTFGGEHDTQPFHVDAVPRVFPAEEWEHLEAGLVQRVRALDAFVADVYGDRAIVRAGVVPARVVESCSHLEPALAEIELPPVSIAVAGLDLVRGADGVLRVLEDNVRTPSGITYMLAARESVAGALPGDLAELPRPLEGALALLEQRWASPRSCSATVLLTQPGTSTGALLASCGSRW